MSVFVKDLVVLICNRRIRNNTSRGVKASRD